MPQSLRAALAATLTAAVAAQAPYPVQEVRNAHLPPDLARNGLVAELDGDGLDDLIAWAYDFTPRRWLNRSDARSADVTAQSLPLGAPMVLLTLDADGLIMRQPLAGIGVLRIDPRAALVLPTLRLNLPSEFGVSTQVPADPARRDAEFGVQFAHVDAAARIALGPLGASCGTVRRGTATQCRVRRQRPHETVRTDRESPSCVVTAHPPSSGRRQVRGE